MISGMLSESTTELKIRFTDLISALSALRSLSAVSLEVESEQILIRDSLQALMQNQDMERCSVFLMHDQYLINITGLDWEDVESGAHDLAGPKPLPVRFRMGEGLIGQAALSRSLQHSPDCQNDPRFKGKKVSSIYPPPGSLISAPIQFEDELLGVLNISHPRTNFFNEWHERLVLTYVTLMGHLICNRRMLRDMENQVKQRTNELEKALGESNLLKKRYESLSLSDELTGLFNRRYFFPQAEIALANSVRYKQPLSLLLMDLDHFKDVNDQFGHLTGDKVLQAVADMLVRKVREGDIIARYGGEEFVVLLPNTHFNSGVAFAERIREAVNRLDWTHLNHEIQLSISIGLSFLDPTTELIKPIRIDQLIRTADSALYQAKEQGRNQLVAAHVLPNVTKI